MVLVFPLASDLGFGIWIPKKETEAFLELQASSSFASRSSSYLSARRKYLLVVMAVMLPCYSLLERAEDDYFIENKSAFKSFFVPQTVAVTKTFKILTPHDRISLSLRI